MVYKTATLVLPLTQVADLVLLQGDILAVDGGASLLLTHHQLPMRVFGDLDSLAKKDLQRLIEANVPIEKYPKEKDLTDTMLALQWARTQGYQRVRIVGFSGGRLDHYQAIIQGVYGILTPQIELVSSTQFIQVFGPGQYTIEASSQFNYVSCFSFQETEWSLSGGKYSCEHRKINAHDTYGVSNEWVNQQPVQLTVHHGRLLVFLSR
jgi:thiamine pyrophosphokinase